MIDIATALGKALSQLQPTSSTARLDAEVLLAHILECTRTYLYAYPEKTLTENQWTTYQQHLNLRKEGKPVAYLVGNREFWSLSLDVNESTLIPRPETERLVEVTLQLLGAKEQATILDLGAGSGAIALAIASERPDWQIYASDASITAIETARKNAAKLNLNNIHIYHSDWFRSLPPKKFDAIVSNPPYIARHDPHLSQGDVRFEPESALISGEDGFTALRHIIQESPKHLAANGLLLLEHGYDQKESIIEALKQFKYANVQSWQDCSGCDRVSGGWYLSDNRVF